MLIFFPGIQFAIQRMGANGSADAGKPNNPYGDANIGVEKLLEINSEENHDDVCLSYVFTYRDFADGVLGLAWVGEAGTCTVTGVIIYSHCNFNQTIVLRNYSPTPPPHCSSKKTRVMLNSNGNVVLVYFYPSVM